MANRGSSFWVLPFFSYGGTALIMQLTQMGIVLNISRSREVVKPVERVQVGTIEGEYPREA